MGETEIMEDALFNDEYFRRKRKNGEWEIVNAPLSIMNATDTHAHLHMLPDVPLTLARCSARDVRFIEAITDPTEDGYVVFDELDTWVRKGMMKAYALFHRCASCPPPVLPRVRIAVGCHPHNAKLYDDAFEAQLVERLADPRVSAVGEIGLDYHYDFSPREVQREVFRRQIRLAKEAGLPISLHLREAHDDGFEILCEEGFPEAGTVLHCFNLGPEEAQRWIDRDCYLAFGGPVTFKKADDVREAAKLVPLDRLLTETDSPYMTPEPLRGYRCDPVHVVFTLDRLMEVRGVPMEAGEGVSRSEVLDAQEAFQQQLYENACRIFDRER